MPFFNNNAYVSSASRFWIWIVLTIPSTALAFSFYVYRRRYEDARNRRKKELDDELELSEVVRGSSGVDRTASGIA